MADFIVLSDFCTFNKNYYNENTKWIQDQPNHFKNKSVLLLWKRQRDAYKGSDSKLLFVLELYTYNV